MRKIQDHKEVKELTTGGRNGSRLVLKEKNGKYTDI